MMPVSGRGGHAVTQCKREIVRLMEANMPITVAAPKSSGPFTKAEALLMSVGRRMKLTVPGEAR